MIRSSFEYLKMVFQTLLKMIVDLRIHQTTENYEQAVRSHVLKTEDNVCCQKFDCKNLFRECLQLE